MLIRKAEEKDIPRILELLGQVLQIHADIRPDIFIPGTTKYTTDELTELLKNEEKPVYVAADEADVCVEKQGGCGILYPSLKGDGFFLSKTF